MVFQEDPMGSSFAVPWTLNDENEFGVGMLPWYFTNPEMKLAVMAVIVFYLIYMPMLGTRLWTIIAALLTTMLFVSWMMGYKKKRHSSWLWDLRLACAILPQQRGMMRSRRGVRWLSAHHVARPSVFLSGASAVGADLSVSAPWMLQLPSAVAWRPLMVPRRERVYERRMSAAPIWFLDANGFIGSQRPRIPIQVTYVLVADAVPVADADREGRVDDSNPI
jgi:hypothetical protein